MHRATWLFLVLGLLPSCVTRSQSLSAGESSGEESSGGSEGASHTETGNEPICPTFPEFTCTVPIFDGGFGPCGGVDFDENCCMRPTCDSHAECGEGEACVDVGTMGLSCSDEQVDGETVCACSADPGGFPRRICTPIELIPLDWCSVLDLGTCAAVEPVTFGENDIRFCQVVDVHLLTADDAMQTCVIEGPEQRCLTIQQGFDPGCPGEPCAVGIEPLVLANPYARSIGPGQFEAFGVDDVFCGSGFPVGDWVHASDASLDRCQMSCGFDQPCTLPFEEYVAQVAAASKDSPVDVCGELAVDAPLADWQAAHECALQHDGLGFSLIWETQGIDSVQHHAYVGLQAESYVVVALHADEGEGFYALYQQPGTGIEATDGCTVEVGELCLTTVNAGETEQICPP